MLPLVVVPPDDPAGGWRVQQRTRPSSCGCNPIRSERPQLRTRADVRELEIPLHVDSAAMSMREPGSRDYVSALFTTTHGQRSSPFSQQLWVQLGASRRNWEWT